MCTTYNWFKYVTGNLVGVGLTDVQPMSGHVVAEMFDLLVAVWSLTLNGLVIAIVGSLAWVRMICEGAETRVEGSLKQIIAAPVSIRKRTKSVSSRKSSADGNSAKEPQGGADAAHAGRLQFFSHSRDAVTLLSHT